MGYIFDIISELNRMDIATEADDITEKIDKDIKSVTGIDESASDNNSNNGEINTNTDDILGTENNEAETQDKATDDQDDEENSEDTSEDGITDEELDESMEEEENPFESSRKKKIHKQFLNFYNKIGSNIKLISEFMPRVVNEDSIKILNSVRNSLTQCKEYAYRILTEEYNMLEYPALLKKYVALNRVYDICIKILEIYYKKYDIENNKK